MLMDRADALRRNEAGKWQEIKMGNGVIQIRQLDYNHQQESSETAFFSHLLPCGVDCLGLRS